LGPCVSRIPATRPANQNDARILPRFTGTYCQAQRRTHKCRHSERPNDEVYAIPLISTRRIEDKVLINNVYDNELLQNGIARGQEIVEIDGIPVEQYAEQRVKP
jgi:hypothetical protein